jgi:hypothetical protein
MGGSVWNNYQCKRVHLDTWPEQRTSSPRASTSCCRLARRDCSQRIIQQLISLHLRRRVNKPVDASTCRSWRRLAGLGGGSRSSLFALVSSAQLWGRCLLQIDADKVQLPATRASDKTPLRLMGSRRHGWGQATELLALVILAGCLFDSWLVCPIAT